jgi:hypothetical protein
MQTVALRSARRAGNRAGDNPFLNAVVRRVHLDCRMDRSGARRPRLRRLRREGRRASRGRNGGPRGTFVGFFDVTRPAPDPALSPR